MRVGPSDSRWVCEGRPWQMLLSAFQQSWLCGSSADAFPPPSPHLPRSHAPPSSLPLLSTGCDVGITRQEQSSQQQSDHTGMVLHVDGGEVIERSRPQPKIWGGLSGGGGIGGVINVGVSAWGQGKGSILWALGTSWDVGSTAVVPVRKADVFVRGCAKFAEQPSAAWRSGL